MTTSQTAQSPVDASTRQVLDIESYLQRVQPRSQEARDQWNRLASGTFLPADRRRAEIERLRRLEEHLSEHLASLFDSQLSSLPTLERPLRRLEAGETLRDADFFEIKRFLYQAVQLLEQAGGVDELPGADADVTRTFRETMAAIHPDHADSRRFHLADELDDELADHRHRLSDIRQQVRDRRRDLESAVVDDYGGQFDIHDRFHPDDDPDLADDDRLAHDTGHIRLDDDLLDRLQARKDEIEQQVRHHEDRQRRRLTEIVDGIRDRLVEIKDRLVALDLRLTRIELRNHIEGCWPSLETESNHWLQLEDGRDPSLIESSGPEAVQPIDIRLSRSGTVVLGPNMGGKSALLRLAGLAAWCGQMALPVPARACRIEALERIVYVGSEEPDDVGPTEGLSSFGREIRRFVDFWESDGPTLWLLDEPCRGTHPDEGTRLAAAIARRRIEQGDRVAVATHFPDLAQRSGFTRLRISGIDADRASLESAIAEADDEGRPLHEVLRRFMDYRTVEDADGTVPRDGWRIARALGLDLPPPD